MMTWNRKLELLNIARKLACEDLCIYLCPGDKGDVVNIYKYDAWIRTGIPGDCTDPLRIAEWLVLVHHPLPLSFACIHADGKAEYQKA